MSGTACIDDKARIATGIKSISMLLGETDEAVFRRGYTSIYRHDNGSFWDVTDKALNDPGWEREQLDYKDTSDLRDILGTVFFLFLLSW